MKEVDSDRKPVGLWACIAIALILSVTAIVLHITRITDRRAPLNDASSTEYQQLLSMNSQLRMDLTRLQDAITESPNYNKFRQSFRQNNAQPFNTPFSSPNVSNRADSPLAALMVLEQSQLRSSFDDYQLIHPADQQKVLEQIFAVNRELKLAYEELNGSLSSRFADVPFAVEEQDVDRLKRVLFGKSKQYEVLETNTSKPNQAEMKVKVTTQEIAELPGTPTVTKTFETKLQAVSDGTIWKISDYPEALAHHQQVLAKLKQRLKDCKAINQRCQKNEFKNYAEFLKTWEALPKDE